MTTKEIKDYVDLCIKHAIDNVEYGNFFADEIKHFTNEAREEIAVLLHKYKRASSKTQANVVLKEIQKVLDKMQDRIDDFTDEQSFNIIDNENAWFDELSEDLDLELKFPKNPQNILKQIPVGTAGSLAMFGVMTAASLQQAYNAMIMQGLITGNDFEELEDDFEPTFTRFDRSLDTDSLTLGESLGSQYQRMVFTKNKAQMQSYMWSSILDTSTCLVCGSLDGKVYQNIADVPIYPVHDRCRCLLIYIPNGVQPEDLKESYEEWFERQPKNTKRSVLGKSRFLLYEQGMKIKQFVNNNKRTPLKTLFNNHTLSSDKAKEVLNKQKPVDPAILNQVVNGLRKNGYSIEIGADTDRLLELQGKEAYVIATNDGKAAIVFHSKVSASGLFEEVIHTAQIRRHSYDYFRTHVHELEVEAKLKLLKYSNSYGITEYEKEIIKEDLLWHQSQIKEK